MSPIIYKDLPGFKNPAGLANSALGTSFPENSRTF